MTKISTTDFDLTLSVCGVERDLVAVVRYVYNEAERGSREGGLQIGPDYPESIEILNIKWADRDITDMLDEEQLDAISAEILGE